MVGGLKDSAVDERQQRQAGTGLTAASSALPLTLLYGQHEVSTPFAEDLAFKS